MPFPNARSILYRYLLGEATDEENRQIEERSLVDERYRETLRENELELIAAYVYGHLTLDMRERFEKHFLNSEERVKSLRFAAALYERVKANAAGLRNSDGLLRQYLLGKLPPDEELKVKKRLLTDDDYKKNLEITEHGLIGDYAREDLTLAEREMFERHFLRFDGREENLKFAETVCVYYEYAEWLEAKADPRGKWSDRLQRWLVKPVSLSVGYRNLSRPIWQPLAAVSVIGAGVLMWFSFFHQSAFTRGLNALHAAHAGERPFEARLSGFDYAMYRAGQSGGVITRDRRKRDTAFALIISEADEEGTPSAHHALGKIYLTDQDFSEAIKCFEAALKNNQDDAKLHNDLAVALMEKERTKSPAQSTGEDAALALEHLHRAIELDASLLDAHFNLALCHQRQTLWRTAEEDWKRYIEKDSTSAWAEEARGNLAKITEKIKQAGGGNRENLYQDFMKAYRAHDEDQAWGAYKRSRGPLGNFIADRLIDDYLSLALLGKSSEAEGNLSALAFIGNIEVGKVQDRFTHDLARFYRGAAPQHLRKLSAARSLTKVATERLMQSQVDEAINNYRQAIDLYNQSGDICESLVTRRMLAHCYYRRASIDLSLPVLTRGREECEARGYIWPLSLFFNELANVNTRLARYSEALDYGQSQMSYAKRVEDDHGVLRAINRVTETYSFLSRRQETLQMVQEGLSLAESIKADSTQLTALYLFASKCHEASGMLLAALDYEQEAFKLSLEINNPWLVSRHYVHLGLAYHRLNRRSEAVNLIRQSGEIGARLPDRKVGGEIMAFSRLSLGEMYRETGDLNNAVESYGDALRLCDENAIDIPWMRFWSKKGLLLTHINQGNDVAAEAELKQVMDLYERHRQDINDETSRNNFFDNEQDIYDIAVKYIYDRQDPRRAFDFAESSRARSLLDAVVLPARKFPEVNLSGLRLPRSIQPLDLGEIQSHLPGKTQLLQYSVLDKHLLIWMVSGSDFKSHSVEVSREALDSKVSDYVQSLEAGLKHAGSDHRARSSELYDLLIKPVERWLDKDAEICIVPDKTLNRLPFASLFSADSGKYLIEDLTIVMSPSANMFIVASDRARRREWIQTERLLSVGNPWFDRAVFRDLKDLPWAAAQASEISAFYPSSTVLLERNARESIVRREIEKSDVAHFAMHYVIDERSPMLSALPLAGESDRASKESDGVLQTFEFYGMELSRLRLVSFRHVRLGLNNIIRARGA